MVENNTDLAIDKDKSITPKIQSSRSQETYKLKEGKRRYYPPTDNLKHHSTEMQIIPDQHPHRQQVPRDHRGNCLK